MFRKTTTNVLNVKWSSICLVRDVKRDEGSDSPTLRHGFNCVPVNTSSTFRFFLRGEVIFDNTLRQHHPFTVPYIFVNSETENFIKKGRFYIVASTIHISITLLYRSEETFPILFKTSGEENK